jgi:phosphonate transport system permease protein
MNTVDRQPTADAQIAALYRARPRSRFVRASLAAFAAFAAYAWIGSDIGLGDFDLSRRMDNAQRFFETVVPYPIARLGHWDSRVAIEWAGDLLKNGGWQALGTTLAISVAAIVLAGLWGALASTLAARNLIRADGLIDAPTPVSATRRALTASWIAVVRSGLIFLRAIPEYIWAFLLIKIFGFTAWPAVLALAIHNAGILGKLGSETIEDVEPERARAFMAAGATRAQTLLAAIGPEILPRFLLYFFYRWETCVREATVLGMLGVLSLGSLVRDARAANFYDEMLFYIFLGSGLVLLGDLLSAGVRAALRRAT